MKHSFVQEALERWNNEADPMTKSYLEKGAALLLETGDRPAGKGDTFAIWNFAVDLLIAYLKETK